LNNIDIIYSLLKIALRNNARDDIIQFALVRYNDFKKEFMRRKRLKNGKKIRKMWKIEEKILRAEKLLAGI